MVKRHQPGHSRGGIAPKNYRALKAPEAEKTVENVTLSGELSQKVADCMIADGILRPGTQVGRVWQHGEPGHAGEISLYQHQNGDPAHRNDPLESQFSRNAVFGSGYNLTGAAANTVYDKANACVGQVKKSLYKTPSSGL